MSTHLIRELDGLRCLLLSLGARVEAAIAKAVMAMVRRDPRLAEEVVAADEEIDRMEVAVEEECLKLLALYQPVAGDLRFIVAALKINNDLERIGDLAVNIAKGAARLAARESVEVPTDLGTMADRTRSMVKRSLDALVNADLALARKVCADDDEVDAFRQSLRTRMQADIADAPERTESIMTLFMAVGHLERIADIATNIAEDVIYTVEGKIIRHGGSV
jgi:phosphate transport system protein